MGEFTLTSWEEAESICLDTLCELTGAKRHTQAFLGFLPPVPNVWCLRTGPFTQPESLWAPSVTSVSMVADLAGYFADRSSAQRWVMAMLQVGELRDLGNLHLFRLNGQLDIQLAPVEIAGKGTGESKKVMLWGAQLQGDFVFHTASVPTP